MIRLSIQITLPVLNEEIQLAASVERLRTFLATLRGYRWEIEIVDNGSTDCTWSMAQNLASMHGSSSDWDDSSPAAASSEVAERVTVRCRRLVERGRGRALKVSWLASQADVVVYMDVDLSTDLAHLTALIDAIARQGYDVAVGSRLAPGATVTRCWRRELLSWGYNWILRKALGLRVRDAQCGFKALSRKAAQALLPEVRDPGWFFDTELLVRAQREGCRIMELPVRWVEDRDSRVKVVSTVVEDLKGIWRLRRIRAQRATMNGEG